MIERLFVGVPGSSPGQVILELFPNFFFLQFLRQKKSSINTPSKEWKYDLVVKCITPTLPKRSWFKVLVGVPGSNLGQVIVFCFQFNLFFPSILRQKLCINTPLKEK
jgi:hypothetical protein